MSVMGRVYRNEQGWGDGRSSREWSAGRCCIGIRLLMDYGRLMFDFTVYPDGGGRHNQAPPATMTDYDRL